MVEHSLFKDEENKGVHQSQFNSGLAKLERIDNIKKNIHKCRIEKDLQGFYDLLLCYQSEIIEYLYKDKDNIIKMKIKLDNINISYDKYILEKKNGYYNNCYHNSLHDFLIFLNIIENTYGLGMGKKLDIYDGMK